MEVANDLSKHIITTREWLDDGKIRQLIVRGYIGGRSAKWSIVVSLNN